jgi:hypothetical protein
MHTDPPSGASEDIDPGDDAAASSGAESDASHPVPSRENVLEFLHEADHEEELDQAMYWVQRALAETLLLMHDQRA